MARPTLRDAQRTRWRRPAEVLTGEPFDDDTEPHARARASFTSGHPEALGWTAVPSFQLSARAARPYPHLCERGMRRGQRMGEPYWGSWGVVLSGRIGGLGCYGNRSERVGRSPVG